jgi:arginyl-tRNA synthetase
MTSVNPYAKFHDECKTVLKDALHTLYPKITTPSFMLEVPPTREFGELASSISFELAKQIVKKPITLANQIAAAIDPSKSPLIQSVEAAGKGYVNFYLNFAEFSSLTLESIRTLDREYGFVKTANPEKIIVEHTSVNPIHPIHIGQARNPVLGDAVARILKAHGHTVFRHYYIDDVGRQSAVIAYGYKKLKEPRPKGKPDHFIGQVYAVTSCIMEIHRLKREIESAKKRS